MNRGRSLTCALVFLAASAFAQNSKNKAPCWLPGESLDCSCVPSYNAAATIDVNRGCGVDLFADLSFTYWLAQEEGLTLAYAAGANDDLSPGGPNITQSKVSFQTSDFKPGFKVGLGMIADHEWVLHAEYTWYRSKNTTQGAPITKSVTLTEIDEGNPTGVWVMFPWYLQGGAYATEFSSTWHLGLDLLDATASRPFYQGRNVIVQPFAGLRAAWIRQAITVNMQESPISRTPPLPSQPVSSHTQSHSWALGPRMGLESQILLPAGFQFEASFAASLLYTKYTDIKHSEGTLDVLSYPLSSYTMDGFGCLRPSAELGLGLGWQTYFSGGKYHLSFSADYDMMVFWSQNMLRTLMDNYWVTTSASPGNLYLQGLTLGGRFDF